MKIAKPTEEDKVRFRSLAEGLPGVEVKAMFGNLGAFVNGNMFMGLFGADIGLKLPDQLRSALFQAGGGPFGPVERPMAGYVTIPIQLAPADVHDYIGQALAFVAEMPPKAPRASKTASRGSL